MKKITFVILCVLIVSCGKKKEEVSTAQEVSQTSVKTSENNGEFDITKIPVSDKDLGVFPYLNPPENYCYGVCSNWKGTVEQKDIKDFDKEYFAVNGKLIPVEGKALKVVIEKNRSKDPAAFNSLLVEKAYEKAILDLGGVQVNNVSIPKEEIDRIGKENLMSATYGNSIDFNGLDRIKTYVIRTNSKEVWIQFSLLNEESGKITILEKAIAEVPKVEKITSSQMKKDINESGKAVLNINFDNNKATLTADGKIVADEILKLLNENPELKLSIEGHTDNNGTKEHNKKLSLDRATTIYTYLTDKGIKSDRLQTKGFGQDNPLAANDSDLNKAKNRRVELVKI
ncbi:OmpA family protein [Elizabethkingia anophelis]|nr:OmpA family protein [Elizabethkingia anophelis]MCT4274911.1 OmpA family protein [Elizabethkingia anophelis]MCT4279003.1 OmpA family protein [Elizabethkingia anophelis]